MSAWCGSIFGSVKAPTIPKRISALFESCEDGHEIPLPDDLVEASGLKHGDPIIIEAESGRITILRLDADKKSTIGGVM